MELYVKKFSELTVDELYQLLRLRAEVFVVEQGCPYVDPDDRDRDAIHIWLQDGDGIQAYLRLMAEGVESEYPSIGRVIAVRRRCGLGSRVVAEAIRIAQEVYHPKGIYLESQVYARSLYEKLGFRQTSDEFLIDGIPHIAMLFDCIAPDTRIG